VHKPVIENDKKTERELLEEVLNAPDINSDPNFKSEIIKDVLPDNKQDSYEDNKTSNKQKVVQENISTNTDIEKSKNSANSTNTEEAEAFDFFGEFETMINNF
jgi:hypothetical protein